MGYPDPCESCTRKACLKTACQSWKTRYLYRQKQINAYARKYGILSVAEKKPTDNPCKTCTQEETCDTICPARAKWWDVGMDRLRGRLGL